MIEGKFLSRFGIIRLLNIIIKHCPFFKLHEDWDKIMSQTLPATFSNASQRPATSKDKFQNNVRRNREYDRQRQPPSTRSNIARPHHNGFGNVNPENNKDEYPGGRPQHGSERYNTQDLRHQGHRDHHISSGNWEWRRNSEMNYSNHHYGRTQHYPQHTQSGANSRDSYCRRPCHNCGKLNHDLSNCRFNYRFKCGRCHEYGHKTRLCSVNL